MDSLSAAPALDAMVSAASALLDPAALAHVTVEHARELLACDGVDLYWWDAAASVLAPLASTSPSTAQPIQLLHTEQGAGGQAFAQRRPVVVEDYQTWGPGAAGSVALGVRSAVAVPLLVRDEARGALVAVSYTPRSVTPAEVRLLTVLAAQFAPALETMRLYAESERQRAEAEALTHLMQRGAAEPDPDRVVALVAEYASRLLGSDYAGVALRDEDGVDAWHGLWGAQSDAGALAPFPTDTAVARRLFEARQTVVLERLGEALEAPLDLFPLHQSEGGRTGLPTPLLSHDVVMGVLVLGWRTAVTPTAAQLRLSETLAGYAATIIENARARAENTRTQVAATERAAELATALRDLAASEESLAAAQQLVHLGNWEQDLVSGEMRWSDEAYRLLGYAPGKVVPTLDRYRDAVHPEDRDDVIAALHETATRGTPSSFVYRVAGPDGALRMVQTEARLERDETGAPRRLVGAALDVTERHAMEAALRHQVLYDALTDLPNRTLLHDRLAQAFLSTARTGRPLALLLLDLDRFKEVNDTLGHHAGDLLLQRVAERLQQAMRGVDTVARLGGDEFAVLLTTADETGALLVARKLLDTLEAPIEVEGQPLQIGASVGIALCPVHGADAQTLLRRADVALYVAKRARGGYAVYAPAQDAHSPDRLTLAAALRPAIVQGELVLHYQPMVALATGRARDVEALARWRHPKFGFVPPDEFIPLAEQTGQIGALTRWVLAEALRQGQAWRRVGRVLTVQVNLSMFNLHDPQLPEMILELLAQYETPPEGLCIELSESVLMADAARTLAVLTWLADQGVRVAVDDFGTGYSSLAYLKRLPVHQLKIDRTFMRDLATDEADAAIVASTIGLGHALGLAVVAEGVEDQNTWERLAELGCDLAQGHYLSQPLPPDEFERWLDTATAPASRGGLSAGVGTGVDHGK